MAGSSDLDLVRRAKNGDSFAFDALVGPLVDRAFRLAFGMLHDREAAEDAVQEATLRAWTNLSHLVPGTEMQPWFLGIVVNQCRTIARGRWWSVLRLNLISPAAGVEFEDRIARGADLRAALRQLDSRQREALVLRYYLDLTIEEVAAIIGVPVGTVKSRIHRGLTALRPFFSPMEALI
jgi:RNA polymerase sigma-70 factor (ECF subfamily)